MNGLILPAQVSTIRSLKDGSISVCMETQEMSSGKAGELFSLRGKIIVAYLSAKDTITQREMDQIDNIDHEVQGKSQSQRIRNTLYRVWENKPEGYKDFDSFYKAKTELYIEHLKSKID